MNKLEKINNELIELRKKQSSLLKEMEKVILAFCKKEYEGKLIVGGDKEFKIRKIISARECYNGGDWIIVATGEELDQYYFFDDIPVKIGYAYTVNGVRREFRVSNNGELCGYALCEDVEKFKDEYNHWLSNIDKFRDNNGEYIKYQGAMVHFFEDGKFRKGLVVDFDTEQNKFEIRDISKDMDMNKQRIIYLEGNEIVKI